MKGTSRFAGRPSPKTVRAVSTSPMPKHVRAADNSPEAITGSGRGSRLTRSGSRSLANGQVIAIDLDDREMLGPQRALDPQPPARAVIGSYALVSPGAYPIGQT